MWRGRSLWKSNELEVWCHDEVSHPVAEDPLIQLGVDGELRGVYRAVEPHPPLGLVAPGLGEWVYRHFCDEDILAIAVLEKWNTGWSTNSNLVAPV